MGFFMPLKVGKRLLKRYSNFCTRIWNHRQNPPEVDYPSMSWQLALAIYRRIGDTQALLGYHAALTWNKKKKNG
jgi:hypothetical protein